MGTLEEHGRRRKRRRDLKKILLETAALAGTLTLLAAAPNMLTALHKLGFAPTPYDRGNIDRARRSLVKQGLLAYDGKYLRLTAKGEMTLHKRQISGLHSSIRRPRWDGRWRALIFDIPEYRKGLREKVRRSLVAVGFERLQDSVWVYPYDCEDFITLLKADFKVGTDMRYLIIDELEYDRPLRQRFGFKEQP